MFRDKVTQLDAITAILCVESSMTTSAIVDTVGNALHSNFTENPDQECILCLFILKMDRFQVLLRPCHTFDFQFYHAILFFIKILL